MKSHDKTIERSETMRKNSIFTRLVSLTVAFAMVLTIGGSVFAKRIRDITLGTAITVSVTKNSKDWYTFTPTHTGEYTLTARRLTNASSTGTIATSTNTTAKKPTWTDVLDEIGSSNATKTLTLIAGTTYGFRVRHGSDNERQYTFTLSANFATISFNGNGSTSTMDSVYPALNQAYTLPACTMTREDYEFAGWATSATGDVVYADQASVTPTGDMTLYAKWNKLDEIEATATDYTAPYDGQAHGITFEVTTPATDYTIEYRTSTTAQWSTTAPTRTDAGTTTVYWQIKAPGYKTLSGQNTITVQNGEIICSAEGYDGVYNGQAHSITVNVTSPTDATIQYGTDGSSWSSTKPEYTNEGTYTVYYYITRSNYASVTGYQTVNITAADMTVTADDVTAVYDGEAHGIEVNVITPASGATVLYGESVDACTLTTSPTYSYGEHTVYYLVTAPNYNDYSGSATVSISDVDIVATAEGYDGPYDDEAHGITVTVTEPESGASVMFGTEEGTYDMEVSPVFTEIGDYTVYYQVTAEGHNPLTGSATVSIGELVIDATVSGYNGIYDGEDHGITVVVNTPAEGASVMYGTEAGTYDLEASPVYSEIGTYTVYYRITAENYAPREGSATVTISENPDRDDAREALIELIAASDEILDEWEDLLPEDLVEALLDAEDAAYEVLNNESASVEQLEAAADNLANALGNILEYIGENTDDEPELTPEQRTRLSVINFVENLYIHALGRRFDVSGRDSWVSLIMDQNGTGTQVARGFLGSQEFLGMGLDDEGFVKVLYSALFNRVPEADEVETWTNALAAGVTREEVINAFFASPEWARTCAYYCVNI